MSVYLTVTHVMWHVWERYVQGLGGETDLKETDHLEDLDVAGRIIRVLKRSVDQTGVSRYRNEWCCCENWNEPSGSNICRIFPD
jgi:hypothetical protein